MILSMSQLHIACNEGLLERAESLFCSKDMILDAHLAGTLPFMAWQRGHGNVVAILPRGANWLNKTK